MWGDPNKNAAAGKHYALMSESELRALPIRDLFAGQGALFVWATCPRLDLAIRMIESWGLYYRGVAFVWVKVRQDGGLIHGQGIPPTATKPTSELCLLATTCKRGRPHPLLDAAVPQVVLSPRGAHSQKPTVIYELIDRLYGPHVTKLELFARQRRAGWLAWGDQLGEAPK
jgi:N6-adenosine-specific RNA methylase IME4